MSTTHHECGIDCQLVEGPLPGTFVHQMYSSLSSTADGRRQYDENQKILNMGKGARKAWRATGQPETRENRVWAKNRVERLWSQGDALPRAAARYAREGRVGYLPTTDGREYPQRREGGMIPIPDRDIPDWDDIRPGEDDRD